MSEYRVGELVDVTIRGRIVAPTPGSDHILTVAYEQVGPGEPVVVYLTQPAADTITITRVAPPEWPPRRDDVWIDGDEDAWYAPVDGQLRALTGSHTPVDADEVLRTYGTLRLVHRKGGGCDE